MSTEREQIIDLTNQLVSIPSRVIEPDDRQMLLDESKKKEGENIISRKRDAALQVLDTEMITLEMAKLFRARLLKTMELCPDFGEMTKRC